MQLLESFANTRILVIGDVMLDRYWWGNVGRISPEAPVPVVRLENTTLAAGGAANVAVNIAGLGAKAVVVGVVGDDVEARLIGDLLREAGVDADHLLAVDQRPTTVKTRVIAHGQQVARVDQEYDEAVPEVSEANLIATVCDLIPETDAVIISDYAKGVLTDKLISAVIATARSENKKVLVDPKGRDYRKYRGSTMITPNQREAADACGLAENLANLVDLAGASLLEQLDLDAVLITLGERGMTLYRHEVNPTHFPASARSVYDVTGAGDTVIATLGTALGAGADLETATRLANVAAGLVVEQVGTASIGIQDLRRAIGAERESTGNV